MSVFNNLDELKAKELIPGFHGKFLHGNEVTMGYWDIDAGSLLPEHHHVHEQVSTVIEGQFEMTVDGITKVAGPGEPIVIPSNAVHSGKAITDCKIIDVFCPTRPEYNND